MASVLAVVFAKRKDPVSVKMAVIDVLCCLRGQGHWNGLKDFIKNLGSAAALWPDQVQLAKIITGTMMVDMDDFSDVLENLGSAANPVKFTTIQHHCHFKAVEAQISR